MKVSIVTLGVLSIYFICHVYGSKGKISTLFTLCRLSHWMGSNVLITQ